MDHGIKAILEVHFLGQQETFSKICFFLSTHFSLSQQWAPGSPEPPAYFPVEPGKTEIFNLKRPGILRLNRKKRPDFHVQPEKISMGLF